MSEISNNKRNSNGYTIFSTIIELTVTSLPTLPDVGRHCLTSAIIDLGMVENVGLAVGISVICHSILETQCTSGLQSDILEFV